MDNKVSAMFMGGMKASKDTTVKKLNMAEEIAAINRGNKGAVRTQAK